VKNDWIINPLYHGENHWWNGWDGPPKCFPDWTAFEWNMFFYKFRSNEISFTQYLNAAIISIGNQCQMTNYINFIKTMCIQENITDCNDGQHYFIEAAQSYHRNPFIAIQYGLYMKETKLIQSIRDPINMVWSFVWHFYITWFPETKYPDPQMRLRAAEQWILQKFTQGTNGYAFNELTGYCTKIKNNITNKQIRKEMMISYLKLKFVNKIIEPKLREDGFVWISNYLSGFLFYLHIFDEIYKSQWDQFKVIQYEWFYKNGENTGYGLQLIRNWVQDKKYKNVIKSDFSPHFYHKKMNRSMHKAIGAYSDAFRNTMIPLFTDCNDVLKHIIFQERQHMLIGGWIDWEY